MFGFVTRGIDYTVYVVAIIIIRIFSENQSRSFESLATCIIIFKRRILTERLRGEQFSGRKGINIAKEKANARAPRSSEEL